MVTIVDYDVSLSSHMEIPGDLLPVKESATAAVVVLDNFADNPRKKDFKQMGRLVYNYMRRAQPGIQLSSAISDTAADTNSQAGDRYRLMMAEDELELFNVYQSIFSGNFATGLKDQLLVLIKNVMKLQR
jgi:hypothetical protein